MGRVRSTGLPQHIDRSRSARERDPRGNDWRMTRPGSNGGRVSTRRRSRPTSAKPADIQYTDAVEEDIVWQIVSQDAEYVAQDVNQRGVYFVQVAYGGSTHRLLVSSYIEGLANPTATIRIMTKETVQAVTEWALKPSKDGICDCDFQHFRKFSLTYNAARLRDRMTRARAS